VDHALDSRVLDIGTVGGLSALFTAQLFVYLLLNGFFGASLAMIWVQFGATGILLGLSDLSWAYLKQYYLPFGLMLSFPEGFITGAFLTMLVLFQPQWVYTFRDEVYQLKS